MLAATNTAGVVLLVLGVIFVVAAGAALYFRSRQKEQPLDIPRGMRPGPSDAALETPLLQKLQGWGVVLVAFFVVFIPYNWLREPSDNLRQEEELLVAEPHRVGQQQLLERTLVAVLDQLPHDRVHHRDRFERRGRGAVRGVLVRLRGDVDEALVVRERGGHMRIKVDGP